MKTALGFLALALVPFVAHATLTPGLPRGEAVVQINGRTPEICVIPSHPADGKYSQKDLEMEKALCSLTEDVNAAVCAKTASSDPGVEFFTVPAGYTVQSAELKNCFYAAPRTTKNIYKKVAKYKNSTSCSYTPSILGYYHVSRLLNSAGQVPPAVLRTLDLERHMEIAQSGIDIGSAKGGDQTIVTTWSSFLSKMLAGGASKYRDAIFTDNFDQTYGALQENPTDEDKYSELFHKEAPGGTRAERFRDVDPTFQQLRSMAPVAAIVGTQFTQANVQALLRMKDVSDMIVLDTLLSQEDRFGNVHSKKRCAYVDTNDIGKDGFAKVKFESKLKPEIAGFRPVIVNQMLLKDNDCGVNRDNRAVKAGLLPRVSHMDPKTYKGLLKFNATADSAEMIKTFRSGMMFTAGDYAQMRTLLADVARDLHARCVAGALKLDLDLDAHFSGRASGVSQCEL